MKDFLTVRQLIEKLEKWEKELGSNSKVSVHKVDEAHPLDDYYFVVDVNMVGQLEIRLDIF